jgi:hypothetical protein
MRRREFIAGLGGAAAWPLAARAQEEGQVRALQLQILRLQAEGAAEKIGHFIKEIESQIGWTTQLTWSASTIEQRRFDGSRLLRQVPAITTLAQLDASGKKQLLVSRLPDLEPEHIDYSHDPEFIEAIANRVYYGPVYFRRQSEPYMTLSVAGTRRDGVSVAMISLKLVWDVVSQIKVGEHGQAYVIDAGGHLIAHPDIGLVLRNTVKGPSCWGASCEFPNTDMTQLAQVRAARTDGAGGEAKDIHGRDVLSAYAPVTPLGWLVFAEMPIEEAK